MISRENYSKIRIHIRTYKGNSYKTITQNTRMEEHRKKHNNKFICSVCLNSDRLLERKSKSQNCCDICLETKQALTTKEKKTSIKTIDKSVQTSHTDLNKNLILLNEVLTVFQNKRDNNIQTKSKTVILKDANISTEDFHGSKPKLGISKVFQFCVDDDVDRHHKTIITSHDDCTKSFDLSKQKSSSVPQMKSEEKKNLTKDKPKSKDAIDEVNRMFATVRNVRRHERDFNRPLLYNGPKILPVAKTDLKLSSSDFCKCCQVKDFSSGDSLIRPECCHQPSQNDKCVYIMCNNYKNHRNQGVYCDRCQEKSFRCKFERDSFGASD